ncbi:hypothetical protein [Pseudomonas syringae]|uniref:hypothetical protein n=1 Tax=Pseudomonas syringae TaxID=317 RepID=UPI0013023846|nr:hypothetical protein [Pseudomonas syringae]
MRDGRRDGTQVHTGLIEDRAWVEGYDLIITTDGVYVIAHRLDESGPIETLGTVQ